MPFSALLLAVVGSAALKPNIVFIHDESTDGRLYAPNAQGPVPIPHINALQARGVTFENHYANVPICAPSRSSMWCGRQPHNMPHMHNGMYVGGAWNNYEGVGPGDSIINASFPGVNENNLIGNAMADIGYNVIIDGKRDWAAGGHSLLTMVDSFSIYARFPYSIEEDGGFHVWGDCGGNLTVEEPKGPHQSAHIQDWNVIDTGAAWIANNGSQSESQPFFHYSGVNIVHPPYATTQHYLDRINTSKISAPEWGPLTDLHPCDMQSTMKKGCALADYQNTVEHKVGVISGYYAMIAEYDDMVGEMVKSVETAGLTDTTVFVLSADHGDMQMQHQQFYKMVAYEASTHVPLVIAAGDKVTRLAFRGRVSRLTSIVDFFPTFVDIGGGTPAADLDGQSLVPFLESGDSPKQRDAIVSQFHGENLAMSWYMVRQDDLKCTFWGTGKEHTAQLFNLSSDPDELYNLAASMPEVVARLEKKLLEHIPYPDVTMEVAQYNLDMARWWVANESMSSCILDGTCRDTIEGKSRADLSCGKAPMCAWNGTNCWATEWQKGPAGYWAAWKDWISQTEPVIAPCNSALEHNWPPAK